MNDDPRNNSLHGFLPNKKLTIISEETNETSAILTAAVSLHNEPGYPFKLDLIIRYSLEDGKGFSITVLAHNGNGDGNPLPFYMGWHPYFKCTPQTTVIKFDPCHLWAHVGLNANMDPTGYTVIDSTFDGSRPIGGTPGKPTFYDDEYKSLMSGGACSASRMKTSIHDVDSDQIVVLWQDFDSHFVHVFTGYTEEGCVAVEPMSGMADSFNNHDGLSTLSNGQTWKGSFGVYVQ